MNRIYTLKAITSAFADTNNDPIESTFFIARSEHRERLEELQRELERNPFKKEIESFENSEDFYKYRAAKKFQINTSFGIVKISYFAYNNYYGSGSLDYFTISESDPIPPMI